ncbi:hypothetical protein BDFB_010391 [Asbolus verrucosus]|uniref:Uncharacterized protein n=1 Tax=Asbolus verrucosus TaxID=1661398 RepID=A0A482W8Q8_ASBVE|nr:hypothetical protein BDFB_010391 [Asbolus verrucosus]
MLIEELLQQEPTYVMMFAPSKFGKTVNLNMISLFCDIEDKNTKTKEDVTKDPIMQKLRSNPLENMKDCRAKNELTAILYCAMEVKEVYLENQYLANSKEFRSDNSEHDLLKQTCIDWLSYSDDKLKSLSVMQVTRGLENLIKSLRIHWGRLPVFLVDQIDKPCVAAMEYGVFEQQVCEAGTITTDVIFTSLPMQDSTDSLQENLDELCEDFKCIFKSMQCESEASICSHILAILKYYADYEKEDIVKLLPGKINPEERSSRKAGTGRDLELLKSPQIEHYVLVGLAVDGDYTTHMLVFQDTADWENVIQVNPENHVAKLISTKIKMAVV